MEMEVPKMVDLVRLRKNENLPGDSYCVTVTRDSSGAEAEEGSLVEHSNGATF
jgi:hypothetical protein